MLFADIFLMAIALGRNYSTAQSEILIQAYLGTNRNNDKLAV